MKSAKLNRFTLLLALLAPVLMVACGEKPETLLASAKSYLAKKDAKSAVIQIKNVLQASPDLAEARFLLGTALLESADPAGAETEFRKALALKYPSDAVIPPLAKAMLGQGYSRKLIEEFGFTELTQPGAKADLQTSLATAYALQGKSELSDAALNAALLLEPGNVPALIFKARKKAGQNDIEGALVMADAILAKSPGSANAWMLKGDILLHARRPMEDVLSAYRQSVAAQPEFLAGHLAVATLLLQQGKLADASSEVEQLKKFAGNYPQTKYVEAQLAFQNNDFKLAADLIQQVLAVAPGNAQALQLAGAVALQRDAPLQAEEYLSKAVQISPDMLIARRLLIVTYLRRGLPAKAMDALLPALRDDNVSAEMLALAGEVYLQNGDAKRAETYFAQAAQQSPKDPKKQTSLALVHMMNGKVEAAFDELQAIAGADTGVTADLALISEHMRRQAFDQALKAVAGLEAKLPGKPLASYVRAKIYMAKRDVEHARQHFERALAMDPNYFPAISSLAGLDMLARRPDDARKRFEAVLAKDPKNGPALLGLAAVAEKQGLAKTEVAKRFNAAVTANPGALAPRLLLTDFLLRNKDLGAALLSAQNAAAAFADSPLALEDLGRVQQANGEFNQAITTYNKLADMQPQSTRAHMRLADVHRVTHNPGAASASLLRALELQSDLLEAQQALTALYVEGKNFASALEVAHTVQKQRPGQATGHAIEGDIHAAQKDWGRAVAAYKTGLALSPLPELAVKIHSVLRVSGSIAQADKFSADWLRDNPKDAVFPFYLGDSALGRQDYVNAEKYYADVVKLRPNNAVAYNNLAWVSARLNKTNALVYAEKANALAPNQPAFMDTLAGLLSHNGDYAKALDLQTKAMALQPLNPAFKLNLAKIHIKGGKNELAKKELHELQALGDKFSLQPEVLALLSGL